MFTRENFDLNKIEDVVGVSPVPAFPLRHADGTPPVGTQSGGRSKRRGPLTRKQIILRIGGVILLLLVVAGVWFGSAIVRDVSKIFSKKGNSVFGLLANAKLKGEDVGRVNILLAGDSADDPGHGGADLTDSIMILSIDTKNHTAFTLSIPRDLWVKVPGYGYQKINAANAEGGMPLLEQTLEGDLGIPINYYALVNYTAFKDSVNAVGGIDVTIASTDPRGLYDANITKAEGGPLKLKNGLQHLDGQTALNLARARGDNLKPSYGFPGSDFDRTQHQRLMLAALATKAASAGVLTNPIKITQLMSAVGNNVQTDFQTNEIRSLASITKGLNLGSAQSLSFVDSGVNLIADYTTPEGQMVLVPKAGIGDFSKIQAYLRKMTSTDPVVREGAVAVVLNGSGVTGLAKKQADVLAGKGLSILATDNAPAPATTTTIIDNSAGKDPATKAALQKLYGTAVPTLTTTAISSLTKAYPTAAFIVILGADQSGMGTTSTTSAGDASN